MIEIGAFEAKNKLSALLDRVELGEVIIITRHGKPIAKLVPIQVNSTDRRRLRQANEFVSGRRKSRLAPSIGTH